MRKVLRQPSTDAPAFCLLPATIDRAHTRNAAPRNTLRYGSLQAVSETASSQNAFVKRKHAVDDRKPAAAGCETPTMCVASRLQRVRQ